MAKFEGNKLIVSPKDDHLDHPIAETTAQQASSQVIADHLMITQDHPFPNNSTLIDKKTEQKSKNIRLEANLTPDKAGDQGDPQVIRDHPPQIQPQSSSQPLGDQGDHLPVDHRIEVGSGWVMDGLHLVVMSVSANWLRGVKAKDDIPITVEGSISNFVKYVDGPAPAPEWLRNVANDPNPLKVGDRVEYIGKPCAAQRFYAFPWRITELVKDKFRCVSAEGDVIPLKCSRQDLRKVEAMAIAQGAK